MSLEKNSKYPLNIDGREFCSRLGFTYDLQIITDLIHLGIIDYFRVGKKRYLRSEQVDTVLKLLELKEIKLASNNYGYTIELTNKKLNERISFKYYWKRILQ